MTKRITFSETVLIYTTYSPDEYDRHTIDSILYKKCFKRISNEEWNNVLKNLNNFKIEDMIVHKSSLFNTKLSKN